MYTALFLYPFVQEVGYVCRMGGRHPVYAEPPMKIIISVKWSSLGREEAVGDTDQEWLYRISRAAKLRTVRESARLSEDADPLTGQLDFIA